MVVPVKTVINSEEKINDFVESGEVVLICSYQQITGPLWKVERSYGTENCPANIDIVGYNVPFSKLRFSVHDNYNSDKFLFVGNFDKKYKTIFRVSDWSIWGMKSTLPWLIPYGFNIYEYRFLIDKQQARELENNTLKMNEVYEADGIV